MKKFILKVTVILISIFSLVLISCEKEDTENVGELKFLILDDPYISTVSIYSIDNMDYPIYSHLKTDSKGFIVKKMNMGNYDIKLYKNGNFINDIGFQIVPNETTSLEY
jgi:hypothetical protein